MTPTFHNLQALRGIACLAVIGFHVACWETEYGVATPGFTAARWFGFAGVDLFFVLSGFIITLTNLKNVGRPTAVPGYLARRLWRIYPVYWVTMVLAAAIAAGVMNWPVFTLGWENRWANWLTLAPTGQPNQYVPPAWTLTFEVMFYLAFAGVLVVPGRIGKVVLVAWAGAVLVAVPFHVDSLILGTALSPFVLEFLGGCLVAHRVANGATTWGRPAVVAGIGLAVGSTVYLAILGDPEWVLNAAGPRVLLFGPAAVLIVYGVVARERSGGRLSPAWLRAVGDASYSIYLWHGVVGPVAIVYGCLMPHSKLPHLGWLAITLAACVGGGIVLHRLVERPLLALAKHRRPGPPSIGRRPYPFVNRLFRRPGASA